MTTARMLPWLLAGIVCAAISPAQGGDLTPAVPRTVDPAKAKAQRSRASALDRQAARRRSQRAGHACKDEPARSADLPPSRQTLTRAPRARAPARPWKIDAFGAVRPHEGCTRGDAMHYRFGMQFPDSTLSALRTRRRRRRRGRITWGRLLWLALVLTIAAVSAGLLAGG